KQKTRKLCLRVFLWYLQESNQGHTDFQSVALPTELRYQYFNHAYHLAGLPAAAKLRFAKAGANIISKIGYTNKNWKKGIDFFLFPDLCSMNLVIDIGNTLVKYAVFDNGRLVYDESSESGLFLSKVKGLFGQFPGINRSLISSVGPLDRKERDI